VRRGGGATAIDAVPERQALISHLPNYLQNTVRNG
jgi:hypothetical protein